MGEPLTDDLLETRWERLATKIQELREAVLELMRELLEEEAERCSRVA